ncbi:MAG: DUF1553 domain-containing protein [Gemmataceae bacterium]
MLRRTLLLAAGLVSLPVPARAADLFRDRVAPLLEQRCLSCHDSAKKRGGLDLSTASGLRAGSDAGPVVLPRQSSKSLLVQVVTGDRPRMPRSGPKLTEAEVGALRQWIEAGAAWPAGVTLRARSGEPEAETWWSLRPLQRPALPRVRDGAWPRNPIDAFILAALEKRGLAPSSEADRVTLLRRLSFDLTGLPPTPAEVEAFLNDHRPGAYERLVERLLASPAYGERWGRHWLDVVHYGDTHGYDKDKRRDHAWPYRDWVIRALNADRPFRDFLREQLAGDVLRPGDPEGIIATGFVVAGPWDLVGQVELREGTVDKEKTRLNDRDDMVTNAIGTFNSLTVGCARCHDHKFDPIPMRDYYRLQAVFAGVERGPRTLPAPESDARRTLLAQQREFQEQRTRLTAEISRLAGPSIARLDTRLTALRTELKALPLASAAVSPSNGWHSDILPTPDHVRWVQVDLGAVVPLEEVRLFPARPVDFPDTPGFGFPLRYQVELSDDAAFTRPRLVADHTRDDVPGPGDNPVVVPLREAKARFIRVTATRLWKRTNDYVFALAELQAISGGKNVAAGRAVTSSESIEAGRWSRRHLVDGYTSRERLPDQADPKLAKQLQRRIDLVREIAAVEAERAAELTRKVPAATLSELARLNIRAEQIDTALRRPSAGPQTYAVVSIAPRPVWLLRRGDVEQKREEVRPGTLSCVTGLSPDLPAATEGDRRLALADWLASDKNPLTWRSMANRLWHYHLGKGIVDTPSDFGKMGGTPSHPELLEWLAVELRQGQSLKHLHRLIVTSATYRQASRHNEQAARIDADNRLLWRMNRQRLDAESIRDAVLAVAGTLDRRMGGPGYELFRFKDDHSPIYDHSDPTRIHDPATYRRTVYRFTVRSVPNPFLDSLDCADPNQPTPVRNATLTALQALALLNNPFVVRQASLFAERLQRQAPQIDQQVDLAFRLALSRTPGPEERTAVIEHARRHGLAAACRALLNANEFIFID